MSDIDSKLDKLQYEIIHCENRMRVMMLSAELLYLVQGSNDNSEECHDHNKMFCQLCYNESEEYIIDSEHNRHKITCLHCCGYGFNQIFRRKCWACMEKGYVLTNLDEKNC